MKSTVLSLLKTLNKDSIAGEIYLTDLVKKACEHGHCVNTFSGPTEELLGINTRNDMAHAEALMQQRLREKIMKAGVTLTDPSTTFLSMDTKIGPDTTIEPFVRLGPK